MKVRMTIYNNGKKQSSKVFRIPKFSLPTLEQQVAKMILEKPEIDVDLEVLK